MASRMERNKHRFRRTESQEQADVFAEGLLSVFMEAGGSALLSATAESNIIFQKGSINDVPTKELAYNMANKGGVFECIESAEIYGVLHDEAIAEVLADTFGEENSALVYECIETKLYQMLAEHTVRRCHGILLHRCSGQFLVECNQMSFGVGIC